MDINKWCYILPLFFQVSCAQIMPLDGGDKDVYAPAPDSATTIPYYGIVNYRGQEIQIGFNEYIRLNDPKENILITPIPDTVPDFKVKNRLLFIKFQRNLQSETTYSIFIDGAIEDITEGNDSLYQFVFSTGDHIDSSIVAGTVKHAFTNEPAEEILVGLFPDQDSAVFKLKPRYIGRTDDKGHYEMKYVKPGNYRLFALNDANKTFTVDQIQESLAFRKEAIQVKDSSYNELILYPQEDKRQLIKKNEYSYPGKVTLVFNQDTELPAVTSSELNEVFIEKTIQKDSFNLWLPPDTTNIVQLFIETQDFKDTITVDRYVKKGSEKKVPLKFQVENKGIVGPKDTLRFISSLPIDSIDTEKVGLLFKNADVNARLSYNRGERSIKYLGDFDKDSSYVLILDSASVVDIYGNVNDSSVIEFQQVGTDYYGTLIVSFDSLEYEKGFIEVLLKDEVVRKVSISKRIEFEQLPPGDYELRMIVDRNGNGKWDTGNYGNKTQPEKVIYHSQSVTIKSNWDMEIKWEINKQPKSSPLRKGFGRP